MEQVTECLVKKEPDKIQNFKNGEFYISVPTDDGRYLACAFPQKEKDKDVTGLACFVVDLNEMQVGLEYIGEVDDYATLEVLLLAQKSLKVNIYC